MIPQKKIPNKNPGKNIANQISQNISGQRPPETLVPGEKNQKDMIKKNLIGISDENFHE